MNNKFYTYLIDEASKNLQKVNGSELYIEYCKLKEKGLRQNALSALDKLISLLSTLDNQEQLQFCMAICQFCEYLIKNDHYEIVKDFIPFNLSTKIIIPVLKRNLNDRDYEPYYWLSKFFMINGRYTNCFNHKETIEMYLMKALDINPLNNKVLSLLIFQYFETLYLSTHHINESVYLGDIEADKELLSMVESLINKLADGESKNEYLKIFNHYKNHLSDWEQFKKSGENNFIDYCKKNKKHYGFQKTYYFDS